MFKIIATQGRARRGVFNTVHGEIQTPVFMNIATQGAIKGGVSSVDLKDVGCEVLLSNTYHLHLRPGDEIVRQAGGIRNFAAWDGPLLTDSGGFQVFSLAKLRKIKEEGVYFSSHIDGRKIFMGPEQSIEIQSNLGSTIAMAFDECIQTPAPYSYVKESCDRTQRWLEICKRKMTCLNQSGRAVNKDQLLFAINQGSVYEDLRTEHMKRCKEFDLDGYAIGGLAVGESAEQMYWIIDIVEPHMPTDKPRYLMGVGTPVNILEAVDRGIDFFDCVLPTRNARHANVYTWDGVMNLSNAKYKNDFTPLNKSCGCLACRDYTRAYIHHLFKAGEILAQRLCVMHNLNFYNELMRKIREAIENQSFLSFKGRYVDILEKRI